MVYMMGIKGQHKQFLSTLRVRSALQFATAVGAASEQSPSCFDSKQQSPMNRMQTSAHVLYKAFALKKPSF